MRWILLAVLITSCGTSQTKPDELPVETREPVRDPELVVYRWQHTRGEEPKLEIEIEVQGEADGSSLFGMSTAWGPAAKIHQSVKNPRAVDAAGNPLPLSEVELDEIGHNELAIWTVTHEPNAVIRFRWEVTNDHAPRRKSTRHFYGPVVREDLVHVIGAFLVTPLGIAPDPSNVRMEFAGLGDGWQVATSLGAPAAVVEERIRVDALARMVFYAGENLRITPLEIDDRPVFLAISGQFRFEDAELAELLKLVVKLQRDIFDDHDVQHFLVSVLPNDATINPETPEAAETGTSLKNGFAAFLLPTASLSTASARGLKNLFAHEMLHHWVSGRIYLSPGPSTGSWFYEGFTTFMTAELLWRGQLISAQEYLDYMNGYLTGYQTSPLRTATNAEVAEAFWKGRDGNEIAYSRGLVLAAMLDRELRQVSNGKQDLDHFLREMVAGAEVDGPLDPDGLIALVDKHTSAEFAKWFAERAFDGMVIDLPPDLLGEGFVGTADDDGVMTYQEAP